MIEHPLHGKYNLLYLPPPSTKETGKPTQVLEAIYYLHLEQLMLRSVYWGHNRLPVLFCLFLKKKHFWAAIELYFFYINFFLIYFSFGCVGSSLLCVFSLVAASGGYSSLRCLGFSLRWLLLLQSMGSRHTGFSSCGLRAPEHRLSSCGTQA